MLNKKYVIITSIFILVFGLFLATLFNVENQIEKSGGIVLKGSDFSNGQHDLTTRVMNKDDKKIDTYSTIIKGDAFQETEFDNYRVLIYHLNSQAYTAYFNGKHIGTTGDMKNARSSSYNTISDFIINKNDVTDENILELKIHSLYMTGLEQHPIGIVTCDDARRITSHITFFSEGFNMIAVGILFFSAIITLVMVFLSENKNKGLFFILFAIIFFIISSLDFKGYLYLPFDYIIFKKGVLLSLFLCMFFMGISIRYFLNSKFSMFVSSAIFIIFTISVIFVNDIIVFKNIYTILLASIGLNFIIWALVAFKDYKKRDEALIITWGMGTFFIMSLFDSIAYIVLGGSLYNSIIVYSLIFSTSLIFLLYLEVAKKNIKLYTETAKRHFFYEKAITDSLTGAYEKTHAISLVFTGEPFSLAMIDIDNFKLLNDTYGHPAGDFVLIQLVKMMKEEFRESDIIGRYGGDELFVGLKGCSIEDAFNILEKFRLKVGREVFIYSDKQISVTLSIGLHFFEGKEKSSRAIERADEALYRAKKAGKNRVSL